MKCCNEDEVFFKKILGPEAKYQNRVKRKVVLGGFVDFMSRRQSFQIKKHLKQDLDSKSLVYDLILQEIPEAETVISSEIGGGGDNNALMMLKSFSMLTESEVFTVYEWFEKFNEMWSKLKDDYPEYCSMEIHQNTYLAEVFGVIYLGDKGVLLDSYFTRYFAAVRFCNGEESSPLDLVGYRISNCYIEETIQRYLDISTRQGA